MLRLFFFLISFLLITPSFAQEKVVYVKYENGNPQVIYYYETYFLKKSLVKKEVYFENGKLEYSGEMKFGKENGEWIYYYPNGKVKAHEHWSNGKENGEFKDYDEKGKLIRTTVYKSGKKIKSIDY